jgi:hypothetical protein
MIQRAVFVKASDLRSLQKAPMVSDKSPQAVTAVTVPAFLLTLAAIAYRLPALNSDIILPSW